MNHIIIILLSVIFILSCTSKNKSQPLRDLRAEKERQYDIDSSNAALMFKRSDSIKMLKMGEPWIEGYNREIFRFQEKIPLNLEYYFTAIEKPDTTYDLISKCVFRGATNTYFAKPTINFKKIYFDDYIGHIDTFLYFEVQQKLTKTDWIKFKEILNGSYYWSFTNPTKEVHKFDPHSLSLESKSILPMGISHGELFYHKNLISKPLKGSFIDAFNFLGQKSELFQKLGHGKYRHTYDFRF